MSSGQDNQATANQEAGDKGFFANMLEGKTPGVRGIEKAYSRAGAGNNHTPGLASKLGSQEQMSKSEGQGVGSNKFKEGISDQRREVCRLLAVN
jgi:hypothetical protein